MEKWLAKIDELRPWKAAIVLGLVGFAIFSTGLANPFLGDDLTQIVKNPVVHSIANIRLFFEGGTFYNGNGLAPLTGAYFRPLMTTTFSLLYTIFGPHAIAFHVFQILLYIGSAILLYLFFRYSFTSVLALSLSMIFLVHPLNSQIALAIPSMQDALFFFFGILALWLMIRFRSTGSLIVVSLCLLLSLLSKETGVLFVFMALLYLFWWDRKRLIRFVSFIVLPLVLWLALKIHAVGLLSGTANNAPIDKLNLAGRLLTAPSILLFYIEKFIFPWKLASGYYWVNPTFSFRQVLLPLVIDAAVLGLFIYAGFMIYRRVPKATFFTYMFFGAWAGIGLLSHLQIVPLDMTACETWFYFPMAGVLGMIGVALAAFQNHIRPSWFYVTVVLVVAILGLRTAFRGPDWRSAYVLAKHDIAASNDDYVAYTAVSGYMLSQSNYTEAKDYALRSIKIYPYVTNYRNLGMALAGLGDYPGAVSAYNRGLSYGSYIDLYERLGLMTLVYGDFNFGRLYLNKALALFPKDGALWADLALLEDKYNDNADAKVAIVQAANYSQVPQALRDRIMNNEPFELGLPGLNTSLIVK